MPPLSEDSAMFTGNGFSISKNRNKKKALTAYPILAGRKSMEKRYPQNSSITICPLSFLFRRISAEWDAAVPRGIRNRRIRIIMSVEGSIRRKNKRPTSVPNVPGATGKYPIKPSVAIFFKKVPIKDCDSCVL
jgi:hypothetical protein